MPLRHIQNPFQSDIENQSAWWTNGISIAYPRVYDSQLKINLQPPMTHFKFQNPKMAVLAKFWIASPSVVRDHTRVYNLYTQAPRVAKNLSPSGGFVIYKPVGINTQVDFGSVATEEVRVYHLYT